MAKEQYKTNYTTLTIEKCFENHYIVPSIKENMFGKSPM